MKRDVSFNFCVRSNFRTKDQTYPVFISGRVGSERGYIGATDIRISSTMSITGNRCKGGTTSSRRHVNSLIKQEEQKLQQCCDFAANRGRLTLSYVKELYRAGGVPSYSFADLQEDFLRYHRSRVGGSITLESFKIYENAGNQFLRYLDRTDSSSTPLAEIDRDMINGYETYLGNNLRRKQNTINNLLTDLKSYFLFAIENDKLIKSPMSHYTLKCAESNRCFLSKVELRRLATAPLSNPEESYVRDCYVFCCFTGLSYSDLKSLSLSELVIISEKTWIYRSRKKTHQPFEVPLVPLALKLLYKYADKSDTESAIFRLLPDNAWTNVLLRRVAEKAGIRKYLTFHTSRHTFATLALSEGVSLESVSKMLGHASIHTTTIYARITNEKIASEMECFERNLTFL